MALDPEQIDSALDDVLRTALQVDGVAAELAAARELFAPDGSKSGSHAESKSAAEPARRRALEWFLLERPSASLQGVPIELAVHGAVGLEGDLPGDDLMTALVSSFCGVFEVTDVRPGEGVWVRDLLAFGEHPLVEPEGSHALESGDVLVGRLFPVGEGAHLISAAAGVFRDPRLAAALAADIERARAQRRGVVRLSQAELESMFWSDAQGRLDREAIANARAVLAAAGLDPADVELVLQRLSSAPYDGAHVLPEGTDTLGTILDALAFETDVDLDAARRALLAAWPALSRPKPATPARADRNGHRERAAVDVRAAIAAFDRGRAEGRELEELFRELEQDLDLEPSDAAPVVEGADEEDAGAELAPDFPGVVGAMVEEFLWETEREQGPEAAEARRVLRKLSAYGAPIGVFEDIGARELLSFGSVWLPEWGELGGAEEARALLAALRAFCAWAEERHEVPLQQAYEAELEPLESSLPRVAEANLLRQRAADVTQGNVFVVVGASGSGAEVKDATGDVHRVELAPGLASHLRPGDHVRADLRASGELVAYCCYPPECGALRRLE